MNARPNIVLILADDMGYGDLGCQNPASKIPTPRLDAFAAEGRRFTDCHAPSAVCSPTRYALLTGRYSWRTEMKTDVLWPWDGPLIEADRLTLPQMLRSVGYHTACIGKWHLGWDWPTTDGTHMNDFVPLGGRDFPLREQFNEKIDFSKPIGGGPITRGFDCYFGDDVPNFPPYIWIENDRTFGLPTVQKPDTMFGNPGPMLPGWTLEQVMPTITQWAGDYIESHGHSDPYFLYFPLTAPHTPIAPLPEFEGRSEAGKYGDYVCEVDHCVGRVLDVIERTGQADDTIVMFMSDNGPEHPCYERIREYGHYSMGDWRGMKRDLWEGGHRVPFIIRWPEHIQPGTVCDETFAMVDIMASIADLLDIELPNEAAEDSQTALPLLLDQPHQAPLRETQIYHGIRGDLALRQGDWVFVDASTGSQNRAEPDWRQEALGVVAHDQPYELFRLDTDPQQARNLYAEEPARAAAMQALLHQYRDGGRSVPER